MSELSEIELEEAPHGSRNRGGFASLSSSAADGSIPAHRQPKKSKRWLYITALVVAVVLAIVIAIIASSGGDDDDNDKPKPPPGPTVQSCKFSDPFLKDDFIPIDYNLKWVPQFEAPFHFSGVVTIQFNTKTSTRCLTVNAAAPMTIDHAETAIVGADATEITAANRMMVEEQERVYLLLPAAPAVNENITVTLSFSAPLDTNMRGLYLSSYKDDQGHTHYMVSTHFEATSARLAFPCMDEPKYKATFKMALDNIPQGFAALSNMPQETSKASTAYPGTMQYTFKESVKMSTYLVAMVSGNMTSVEKEANGKMVRVWARPGFEDMLQFALDTAAVVMPFYEDYFGVAFPLPKQDLVAIPDFAAGAMENWGLITFRETALLASTTKSSASELLRVAVVVSHELVHQWFGDLVTIKDWSELWLNEGFASMFEYNGVEESHPDFKPWSTFLVENPQRAMVEDSYAQTHPLSGRPVNTPEEIESMFDTISYNKGASVIRFVQSYADATVANGFQTSLQHYMNKYKYSNTVYLDLWQEVANTLGDNELLNKLNAWTVEEGFPVVKLQWKSGDDNTMAGELTLTQERYFRSEASKQAADPSSKDTVWWIPLHFEAGYPAQDPGIDAANQALDADGFFSSSYAGTLNLNLTAAGWIKTNHGQSGYYRVLYPKQFWAHLGDAILKQFSGTPVGNEVSANDRSGLVDDALAFAFYGDSYLPIETAMDFVYKFLPHETDYQVWDSAISRLNGLYSLLFPDDLQSRLRGLSEADDTCIDNFEQFMQQLLDDAIAAVGWDERPDDSPQTIFARSLLLGAGSYYGHRPTIDEGLSRWANRTTTPIPPNLQSLVENNLVRWGGEDGFNEVLELYKKAVLPSEIRVHLRALTVARDEALLSRSLEFALSSDVRKQDSVRQVTNIAHNPRGRSLAWKFVKDNWATFDERYGHGGFDITELVSGTTSGFSSTAGLNDVKQFFQSHPTPGAALEIKRAEESIQGNMAWVQGTGKDKLCAWVENAVAQ